MCRKSLAQKAAKHQCSHLTPPSSLPLFPPPASFLLLPPSSLLLPYPRWQAVLEVPGGSQGQPNYNLQKEQMERSCKVVWQPYKYMVQISECGGYLESMSLFSNFHHLGTQNCYIEVYQTTPKSVRSHFLSPKSSLCCV